MVIPFGLFLWSMVDCMQDLGVCFLCMIQRILVE